SSTCRDPVLAVRKRHGRRWLARYGARNWWPIVQAEFSWRRHHTAYDEPCQQGAGCRPQYSPGLGWQHQGYALWTTGRLRTGEGGGAAAPRRDAGGRGHRVRG